MTRAEKLFFAIGTPLVLGFAARFASEPFLKWLEAALQ
jgi:hypothetical protein